MGFGNQDPNVQRFDPTNPAAQGTSGAAGDFFNQLFQSQTPGQTGQGFPAASTLGQNPLAQGGAGGGGNLQSFLSQLMQQGAGGIGQQGFQAGQNVNQATQGGFLESLRAAQGQLTNTAPSVASTAFAGQGIDLASRALAQRGAQTAQNLFQGQGLDLQAQNQLAQQGLGAGGLISQLLGLGTGFLGQNPLETVVQPGAPGIGSQLLGVGGTVGGSFLGRRS